MPDITFKPDSDNEHSAINQAIVSLIAQIKGFVDDVNLKHIKIWNDSLRRSILQANNEVDQKEAAKLLMTTKTLNIKELKEGDAEFESKIRMAVEIKMESGLNISQSNPTFTLKNLYKALTQNQQAIQQNIDNIGASTKAEYMAYLNKYNIATGTESDLLKLKFLYKYFKFR